MADELLIIDDDNYTQFVDEHDARNDGLPGITPRETEQGGLPEAKPMIDEIPLIPKSEWAERARIMTASEAWPNDRRRALARRLGRTVVKDQNGLNYCFPAGTLIRMADGSEKPIQDVRTLDSVLTAEGRCKTVLATGVRRAASLYKLNLWGHRHLRATGEHPILTQRGYVALKEVQPGDMVALTKYAPETVLWISTANYLPQRVYANKDEALVRSASWSPSLPGRSPCLRHKALVPDIIHLTYDVGRLIGLFLAEGHTSYSAAHWSFNITERETLGAEVIRILTSLGCESRGQVRPNNVFQVVVDGVGWSQLLESLCGRGAAGKCPAKELMAGPVAFLDGMLSGWIDGDRTTKNIGCTVSHSLAVAMYDIAASLGRCPIIQYKPARRGTNGRWRKPVWHAGWNDDPCENHGTHQTDTHVFRKVDTVVQEAFDGYVYNFEVDGDNSYVAEGVAVHNCHLYALTNCLEDLRDSQGLPYIELAPETGGGAVGWYNSGGAMDADIRYVAKHGIATREFCEPHVINPRKFRQGWEQSAQLHIPLEWFELGHSGDMWAEVVTALLSGLPVYPGYSWWRHSVMLGKLVGDNLDGEIENSWGSGWGNGGYGILAGSRKVPTAGYGCFAPRVIVQAAA